MALLIRLVAVIFSQGFIQSDDFYDTVEVSYDWLRDGLLGEDGHLRWKEHPSTSIVRFPLYTLFLFVIMKSHLLAGITALDQMMYSIRFIHALVSLLPVWVIYKLTEKYTGDARWAFWAALLSAWHFAMPFLGVRNLIEMAGGNLWIVAVYHIYHYQEVKNTKSLYWAGFFTGLAWMIRFQISFAVIPVPFLLWYENKNIRSAVHYSLAVIAMLLIAALTDKALLGYWAASTINNLSLNTGLGTVYETVTLMYPLILLVFFIPPFSIVMVRVIWQKKFWQRHRILIISTLCFIIIHSLHPNQQERFMLPIVSALMLLFVMALWHRYEDKKYILLKNINWRRLIVFITAAMNLVLLIFFTTGYGNKGLIEPLIWLERMDKRPKVLFVQPSMQRWIPEEYAGYERIERDNIRDWSEMDKVLGFKEAGNPYDYLVLYPKSNAGLALYLDSIKSRSITIIPVKVFEPSLYDKVFHVLNPGHYQTYKAYVYRPIY